MKAKVKEKDIKYLHYNDIYDEGWYKSGNWHLLFLKDTQGLISPRVAIGMQGKVFGISNDHSWNRPDSFFTKSNVEITI